MGRKKSEPGQGSVGRPAIGKPVAFRASDELVAELEYIASGLDIDVSALVRMVLAENLGPYKERAEIAIKRRAQNKPPAKKE